jgi:hypothetical protein
MMEKSTGQIAYEAYCETTGWKSRFNGDGLPEWKNQDPEIQACWTVAGEAVAAAERAAGLAERNRLARALADVRDDLNAERAAHAETGENLSMSQNDRAAMSVRLHDGDVLPPWTRIAPDQTVGDAPVIAAHPLVQIGWQGQSGRIYHPIERPQVTEPGAYWPIYRQDGDRELPVAASTSAAVTA